MKKMYYVLAFMFMGFSGIAQEATSTFEAKTIDLIEKTSGGQFEVIMKPIVQMVPAANREAFKAEVKASMDDLYKDLAVIYMESYTEEDVDAILAFYNTPVGKKMLDKNPEITQKSMQVGQQWGMKLQPLMAKYAN